MTLRQWLTLGASTVVSMQTFTQVLALKAHYSPLLGTPLAQWQAFYQTHGLYWPWDGLQWAWQWGTQAPDALRTAGLIAMVPLAVGLLACQGRQRGWRKTQPPPMEGHGSATWSTQATIKLAGVFAAQGIVLAGLRVWLFWWRILRFNGEENVIVVGPARSGKGTTVFIPTILEIGSESMNNHLIIIDIRGETYDETWRYRATNSRVLQFAITQPGSARFSLPMAIRKGTPYAFFDAATIAEMHIHPGGKDADKDPHFGPTARAMLTCALLYEVHTQYIPTMAHLASTWSQPGRPVEDFLQQIVRHAPTHTIAELAQEVLNKSGREASAVLSTMMRSLFLYRDPTIATNTAYCDFRIEDFMRQDRYLSLYIVLSPSEIAYVGPFMRAFLQLAEQRWMELGTPKHRITQILDEFIQWGTMPFIETNLAVLGGKGIRTILGVQDIPQVRDTYGHADTILEKCKVKIYFGAQGTTTGQAISHELGTGTATTLQASYRASGWSWLRADSRTQQEQQHSRALLTDAEAMQIPPEVAVVQVTGYPPIWARKVRFWRRRVWQRRAAGRAA